MSTKGYYRTRVIAEGDFLEMMSFFAKPKIMVFFISYNCNGRCVMCNIWKKQNINKELSFQQIENLFSDKLLSSSLEIINITGGEPTLRNDLVEIVKVITKKCINLKRIDIPTNGFDTDRVVNEIEKILPLLLSTNAKLTVTIALDGIGKTHELVRGRPNIFTNVEQTIEELKELTVLYPFFSFNLNMTINKLNYYAIEEMRKYATQKGIGINFTLAAISEIGVESIQVREKFEMNQEEKAKVVLFLEDLLKEGEIDSRYAKFTTTWLKTGRRHTDCAFKRGRAFLLEPNGETYVCGNFKEFRIGNIMEEQFERMWGKAGNILKRVSSKCKNCVSNCYMDEVG